MQKENLIDFFKLRMKRITQRRWNCPDESTIAAYADRQLSGTAKDKLEAHLADCDFCLGQVAYLIRSANAPAAEQVPAALLRRAKALGEKGTKARGSALWHWGKFGAAAATACLVLVVAISLRNPQTVPTVAPHQNPITLPAHVPSQIAPMNPIVPPPAVRGGHKTFLEPTLAFPAAGATVPESNIDFRWQPVAGTLDYEVKLLTADGDLVWTQSTAGSSLRLPADVKLEAGKKYFVQVRANFAEGKSAQSAPVAFTVAERR